MNLRLGNPHRVALFGSTGVLGKRVKKLLESGDQPIFRVYCFQGDISNTEHLDFFFESMGPFDCVVNCAGMVPVEKVSAFPFRAFEINAMAPGLLLRAAKTTSESPFILHISSSHVYLPSKDPIGEQAALGPISTYGKSKLSGDFIVESLGVKLALDYAILRLFSMCSIDQDPSFLFPRLEMQSRTTRESQPFKLPGWNNVRDFASADFYAEAVYWVLQNRVTGIYNVGSGVGTTVGELAQKVAKRSLRFQPEDLDSRPTSLVADTTKLSAVGWIPTQKPLEGLVD